MKEIWKPVPDYEKYYQVSSHGRIKSLGGRVGNFKSRILKLKDGGDGYLHFRMNGNKGGQKLYSAHRMVAKVFIPNPQNKPQINHKNCVRSDNRVENLEWVTAKENMDHAKKTRGEWRKGANKGIGRTSTPEGKREYMREYFKTYKRKDRTQ